MKRLLLALCILCICIPVYSSVKDYTILEKSVSYLQSVRASAINAETNLKSLRDKIIILLDFWTTSTTTIVDTTDKTNMETIKIQIDQILTDLNALISNIDTLYPEIK